MTKVNVYSSLARLNRPRGAIIAALGLLALFAASCGGAPPAQQTGRASGGGATGAPLWMSDLGAAYPPADWMAAPGSGSRREAAENAALAALARMFKTDVESLSQANRKFSQIMLEAEGKKTVSFDESKSFTEDITTAGKATGLIGVQIDTYQSADGTTWNACARMNRAESAARYSGMVKENAKVIGDLAARGRAAGATMDAYAAYSFAAALAEVTDNFQNLLEVIDPTATSRRPTYGGAKALRDAMMACAARITIAVRVKLSGDGVTSREETTLRRALAAFFTDRGFKATEGGTGDYTLDANVSLEALSQAKAESCRFYFDAALKEKSGKALFSYTGDERAAHLQASEARRLALRQVETSIKDESGEKSFAQAFAVWLGELLE